MCVCAHKQCTEQDEYLHRLCRKHMCHVRAIAAGTAPHVLTLPAEKAESSQFLFASQQRSALLVSNAV